MKKDLHSYKTNIEIGVLLVAILILIVVPFRILVSSGVLRTNSVQASSDAFGGGDGSGSTGSIGGSGGGGTTAGGSNGGGASGGNSNGGPRPGPDTVGGTPDAPGALGGNSSSGASGGNANGNSGNGTNALNTSAGQDFLKSVQTVYGANSTEAQQVQNSLKNSPANGGSIDKAASQVNGVVFNTATGKIVYFGGIKYTYSGTGDTIVNASTGQTASLSAMEAKYNVVSNASPSGTGATSPASALVQQDFLNSIQTVYGATSPQYAVARQDIVDFNRIERAYGADVKQAIINKLATYDQAQAQAIQHALSDFLAAAPGPAQDAAAANTINAIVAAATPDDLKNIVAAFNAQPAEVTYAFMTSLSNENKKTINQAAKDYFNNNLQAQQSLVAGLSSYLQGVTVSTVAIQAQDLVENPTWAKVFALLGVNFVPGATDQNIISFIDAQILNIPGTNPSTFAPVSLQVTAKDNTTYSINIATADGGIISAFVTAGVSLPPGVGPIVGMAINQAVAAIGAATVKEITDAVPSTGAFYDKATATLGTVVNGSVTCNCEPGTDVAKIAADVASGKISLTPGKIKEMDLSSYAGTGAGRHSSAQEINTAAVYNAGGPQGISRGTNTKIRIFIATTQKISLPVFKSKTYSPSIANMVAFNNLNKNYTPPSTSGAGFGGGQGWISHFYNLFNRFGSNATDTPGYRSGYGSEGTSTGICIRPRITSVQAVSARVGRQFSYKITASGTSPLSIGADVSSLPSGFSYSSSTQVIMGTFASSSLASNRRGDEGDVTTYKIPLTVSNVCGQDSFKLNIQVNSAVSQNNNFLSAVIYSLLSFWGIVH